MTVSYQYDVASSTSGGFTRLLFKWKGSVYKLVWRELLWFTFAYTLLSILYREVLTPEQKKVFERVVDYFNTFLGLIPLSFVLGVYVTLVVTRWWQQFLAIPWPDKLAHCIALYVTGTDDQSRIMRRTLARYLNLSLILVLRSISMAVKKRFPTLQHLVEGGFMTKVELEIYQSVPSSEFNTYWIPCTWLITMIKEARKKKMIEDSQGLKLLVEEFNEFRSKCGLLWSYDWVSIPLVYTQVVTLATYSFFAVCVIGRQYVAGITEEAKLKEVDLYIPFFTLLQFFFYMGLLKVAEALINPFGDDDEDFELNWMIDRHLKVSYLVVDTLMNRVPPLVKDAHYDDEAPTLAYTKAAMMYKKKTFRGSVAAVLYESLSWLVDCGFTCMSALSNPAKGNVRFRVPEEEQTLVLPEIAEEDEENNECNSDVSINKHSSSIINLLNWTSSSGSRLLHHHVKRSSSNDLNSQRSASIVGEELTMESGIHFSATGLYVAHSGTFGGSHPTDVFGESIQEENNQELPPVDAPPTSGIRGESFPSLVGSLESIHSSKTLNPTLSQSAKAILRGDSLPEKRAENVTDDSISRKTKSLDTCHGIASHAEITEVEKHKTRPHFLRLRDIKRKHKKQSQSPPRARHRCWQSKESVEVTRKEIELNEVVVTDGLSDDPVKVPTTISLSLPSLHLGGMQETKEDQRAVGECSARKDSITDQESKFDGSNGSREKLSSLIDSPSVEFQSSRSPTCGDQRQGERVHCRSPNGDASPGRIRHLNSRSTEHNSK